MSEMDISVNLIVLKHFFSELSTQILIFLWGISLLDFYIMLIEHLTNKEF